MQIGMRRKKSFYLIEVISEQYDKMPEEEQIKTIIHELMHIPKSFGGGFIHHNKVHEESVGKVYENYINLKRDDMGLEWH
jgi:predicted metallopeptidase